MTHIEQLEALLTDKPDDTFLTHALALEYRKAGNPEKAQRLFQANLSKHPEYIATYYHYGQLLANLDAEAEAIRIYEKGMELAKSLEDKHTYSELRSALEELTF